MKLFGGAFFFDLSLFAPDAFGPSKMSDLMDHAVDGGGAASQPVLVREKPPISIYPQLKNVVSSVDLGTRIDLKGITMRMRNAECLALVSNSFAPTPSRTSTGTTPSAFVR
jgi:hypothetical protein